MDTFSETLTQTVEELSQSVVHVNGRRGYGLAGIVYTEDVVVTTNRAVERDENITATLANGDRLEAALVGRDPRTDIAVLKLKGAKLSTPTWTEVDTLKVGQLALRLGQTADGVRATLGIVSGLGGAWRTPAGGRIEHAVKTDAAPFRGFSGGPLVTLTGEVIGMSTAALNRQGDAVMPTATLKRVAEMLLEHGHVRRGYLGIGTQPVRLPEAQTETLKQRAGLLIVSVEPDSPAAQAELVLGDVLLTWNGEAMHHPKRLLAQLDETTVGKDIAVTLLRGGELKELSVAVGEKPAR